MFQLFCPRLCYSSKLESLARYFMFGPSVRSNEPTMPSADFCNFIPSPLNDSSQLAKLQTSPGNAPSPSRLCPPHLQPQLSVPVSDFEDNCLLIQLDCLICDFCSSGQRFACGFLQIPPRDGHPCRPANDSPCRVRRRLSLPSKSALPGARHIKMAAARAAILINVRRCYLPVSFGTEKLPPVN